MLKTFIEIREYAGTTVFLSYTLKNISSNFHHKIVPNKLKLMHGESLLRSLNNKNNQLWKRRVIELPWIKLYSKTRPIKGIRVTKDELMVKPFTKFWCSLGEEASYTKLGKTFCYMLIAV